MFVYDICVDSLTLELSMCKGAILVNIAEAQVEKVEVSDESASLSASSSQSAIETTSLRMGRRELVSGLRLGTLAALVGGAFAGCTSHGNSITGVGTTSGNNGATRGTARDIDILNFALNLEYLEAEFYTYATTGQGIEAAGIATSGQNGTGSAATPGVTTGGVKVNFGSNSTLAAVATQLANDEQLHVTALRSTISQLGGTPVAKPTINLAALAAQGVDISTVNGFLIASRAFEDTGVSAYGGAAMFISNPNILQAAARILGTESYHAANIRVQIAQLGVATKPTDALDVPPPPTGALYFDVDPTNALAIVRTPRQVLNIVLGAVTANATTGGFFPKGAHANLLTLFSLSG